MADSTRTKGETWPPERFRLKDAKGKLIDLTLADESELLARGVDDALLISGPVVPIDPPDEDECNAEFVPQEDDYSTVSPDYDVEIKVTWDKASSPKKIQFFPTKNPRPTLEIVANNEEP